MKITSTEFQQDVGRYQDAAQQSPVAITRNGRTHTVLMSATFFEMVMRGRVARKVEDLDEATLDAIARAEVSTEHAHLDELLEDWKPGRCRFPVPAWSFPTHISRPTSIVGEQTRVARRDHARSSPLRR